jgi:hypothetical protein
VETAGPLLVEVEDTVVSVVIGDSELVPVIVVIVVIGAALVELGMLFVTLPLLFAPPPVAVGKASEDSVGNVLLGF